MNGYGETLRSLADQLGVAYETTPPARSNALYPYVQERIAGVDRALPQGVMPKDQALRHTLVIGLLCQDSGLQDHPDVHAARAVERLVAALENECNCPEGENAMRRIICTDRRGRDIVTPDQLARPLIGPCRRNGSRGTRPSSAPFETSQSLSVIPFWNRRSTSSQGRAPRRSPRARRRSEASRRLDPDGRNVFPVDNFSTRLAPVSLVFPTSFFLSVGRVAASLPRSGQKSSPDANRPRSRSGRARRPPPARADVLRPSRVLQAAQPLR